MITRNSTGELKIDSFERRQSFDEHCETGEATQNLQNHIWQGSGLRFYSKKVSPTNPYKSWLTMRMDSMEPKYDMRLGDSVMKDTLII